MESLDREDQWFQAGSVKASGAHVFLAYFSSAAIQCKHSPLFYQTSVGFGGWQAWKKTTPK